MSGPLERMFYKCVAIHHPAGSREDVRVRSSLVGSGELGSEQEIFEERGLTEAEAR